MTTANKIMIGIIVAIFVLAGAGVLYGVLTHEEPGLMHEDKRWASMPLEVTCTGYVESRNEDCGVARSIVGRINSRLGFSALSYREAAENPDVEITIGVPYEEDWTAQGGNAELAWEGSTYTSCGVQTSNTGTIEMLSLVLHHELGHCLGLAHDDYEQSIMRPVQSPTPDRTIPPWISDWDRDLLRRIYRNP